MSALEDEIHHNLQWLVKGFNIKNTTLKPENSRTVRSDWAYQRSAANVKGVGLLLFIAVIQTKLRMMTNDMRSCDDDDDDNGDEHHHFFKVSAIILWIPLRLWGFQISSRGP